MLEGEGLHDSGLIKAGRTPLCSKAHQTFQNRIWPCMDVMLPMNEARRRHILPYNEWCPTSAANTLCLCRRGFLLHARELC